METNDIISDRAGVIMATLSSDNDSNSDSIWLFLDQHNVFEAQS